MECSFFTFRLNLTQIKQTNKSNIQGKIKILVESNIRALKRYNYLSNKKLEHV